MWETVLEKIFKNPFFDRLNSIASSFINALKPLVYPYFAELKDFQFTIANPLFWVFFLIAVFFLNCFWNLKKAFIFCLTVAIILLSTTALENSMVDFLSKSALFDYMVLRCISLFLILCVLLYFLFIRLD